MKKNQRIFSVESSCREGEKTHLVILSCWINLLPRVFGVDVGDFHRTTIYHRVILFFLMLNLLMHAWFFHSWFIILRPSIRIEKKGRERGQRELFWCFLQKWNESEKKVMPYHLFNKLLHGFMMSTLASFTFFTSWVWSLGLISNTEFKNSISVY